MTCIYEGLFSDESVLLRREGGIWFKSLVDSIPASIELDTTVIKEWRKKLCHISAG